jgi:hypothetical protein
MESANNHSNDCCRVKFNTITIDRSEALEKAKQASLKISQNL